eukprot:6421731-Pyramimonas_sp.AAC.1
MRFAGVAANGVAGTSRGSQAGTATCTGAAARGDGDVALPRGAPNRAACGHRQGVDANALVV